MHIAILQKYPMHTEIIGPIVYILHELGHTCDIYRDTTDRFDMVPIYEKFWDTSRVRKFDIRNMYTIDLHTIDAFISITSDEWKSDPEIDFMKNIASKLIVIHHSAYRYEKPYFYRTLYLTPYNGENKWFFPIFPSLLEIEKQENGNGVMIIGATSWQRKDAMDICRFLEGGNQLYMFARQAEDEAILLRTYKNIIGMYGLPNQELFKEISKHKYIWCPFQPSSIYSNEIYSNCLGLGTSMNKMFIMPEHLAKKYRLEDACLKYKDSIFEILDKQYDEDVIFDAFQRWKQIRLENNKKILRDLLNEISRERI